MCLLGLCLTTVRLGETWTIHSCSTQRSLLETTFTHETSTYLSSQRRIKVELKSIYRRKQRREFARNRQGKFKIKPESQRPRACTRNRSTAWRRQQKPRGWGPLTSTGPGLSASTSPWAASLHCRGDSITSSFLTLLLLVLNLSACILGWKRKSESLATGTAASPWLCKAPACQGPEDGKEADFPGTSGQPCRLGLQSLLGWEGQPPGVLLLLGKWEVPTHRPKENKPQTAQCTVHCLFDKDRPHRACSTRRGPHRPESK